MKIELNTDEVREIMEAYFQSIGAPVEIKSIMVTYEQVVMDATLNPQPTAAPRQCVEPMATSGYVAVIGKPEQEQGPVIERTHIDWGGLPYNESASAIHIGSDGRRLTDDEVRELHK